MTTFTPGPWKIRSQAPVGGVYTLTIEQVEGRMIGEVWASHGKAIGDSSPEPEGRANALLIAAAPELYEALQQAHAELSELRQQERYDGLETIDKARAALAKAGGTSLPRRKQ